MTPQEFHLQERMLVAVKAHTEAMVALTESMNRLIPEVQHLNMALAEAFRPVSIQQLVTPAEGIAERLCRFVEAGGNDDQPRSLPG